MSSGPGSWRSLHFVPAGSDKMLVKAASLAADALILDLEDSVPPADKPPARERAARWLDQERSRTDAAVLVRPNPLDSPWGADDLRSLVPHRPAALMVPKVESRADLDALDRLLCEIEIAHGIDAGATPLVPIATETPRALLHIEELADAPRVAALTWGAEDLSAALGGRRNRDASGAYLELYRHARWSARLAASAAGIPAIDGVYPDFGDLAGLQSECVEAADVGFSGKLSIHPCQLEVIRAAFTPTAEEIAESHALLHAYEAHRRAGRGAFVFGGEMVDAPHLTRARALLARARITA